jgi:hypothetical protein
MPKADFSLPGFRAVLDFLASQGVTGIVPGDLIGEYPALSLEERQQLIEAAVELGRKRFVVAALVSDASIDTAMGLARFAERAGADAIKVALPYPYVRPTRWCWSTCGALPAPARCRSSSNRRTSSRSRRRSSRRCAPIHASSAWRKWAPASAACSGCTGSSPAGLRCCPRARPRF